jgi:hypothetical protein
VMAGSRRQDPHPQRRRFHAAVGKSCASIAQTLLLTD